MLQHQKTVNDTVTFKGKALHSGRIVKVEVRPAVANTGIVFKRIDSDGELVRAIYSSISSTQLSTTIGSGASSVSTIEKKDSTFITIKGRFR